MSEVNAPHVINNDMHNLKTINTEKVGKNIIHQLDLDKEVITPEQAVAEYLNDPKVKLNSLYWANHLNERFNGNWFTVEKVQKKVPHFKLKHEALDMLQLLCLVGVCIVKDSKYKITLDLDQRITLMKSEVDRVKEEKAKVIQEVTMQYDIKVAALENEIKRMENIE